MSHTALSLARGESSGELRNAVPFNGQDFNKLKSECLQHNQLFCDETFGGDWDSLGFNTLGKYSSRMAGVQWKRPTELCSDPQFIVDGAKRTDICQGELGDCWLLAAIASLTLDTQILNTVVPSGQSFNQQYAGIFHFKLWRFGGWVDVVVDDRLPTKDGQLVFVHSAEGREFWSALLEKAYAKVCSSYEALSGGSSIEGFEDFTGGIAESYDLKKAPPLLFHIMRKALQRGSLLGCSIPISSSNEREQKTRDNLVKGHAYSITAAYQVQHSGSPVELVRIRNPWGQVEWTGAWSDGSREWSGVDPQEKKQLDHRKEDGEFWMSYRDFLDQFYTLEICNLTADTLTDAHTHTWLCSEFSGEWKVGSTAGGCLNYKDTFCSNPQFFMRLQEADDDCHDNQNLCSAVIGLMQKDTRREKRFGRDLNSIGFVVFQVPDEYKGRPNLHLGPYDLLRQRPVARTDTFINRREVCQRVSLPPGDYVIIPSTYAPHVRGAFILRVFTEKQAVSSPMEEDVNADITEPVVGVNDVDPHFKRLFVQISGNDSEVSAFELQKILGRVVSQRSDVKIDGFSLQTCRNIISLLDTDGSSKLGLMEFHALWIKMQKYLEIFKSFDSDSSGDISSHDMRAALAKAGFQLNSAVLQELVGLYADERFAVDFDCFLSCLIRLELLFKIFRTLDKKNQGKIQLDLQQWICLAIN